MVNAANYTGRANESPVLVLNFAQSRRSGGPRLRNNDPPTAAQMSVRHDDGSRVAAPPGGPTHFRGPRHWPCCRTRTTRRRTAESAAGRSPASPEIRGRTETSTSAARRGAGSTPSPASHRACPRPVQARGAPRLARLCSERAAPRRPARTMMHGAARTRLCRRGAPGRAQRTWRPPARHKACDGGSCTSRGPRRRPRPPA